MYQLNHFLMLSFEWHKDVSSQVVVGRGRGYPKGLWRLPWRLHLITLLHTSVIWCFCTLEVAALCRVILIVVGILFLSSSSLRLSFESYKCLKICPPLPSSDFIFEFFLVAIFKYVCVICFYWSMWRICHYFDHTVCHYSHFCLKLIISPTAYQSLSCNHFVGNIFNTLNKSTCTGFCFLSM